MFPQLAQFTDLSLLLPRLMVAAIFVTSGWSHLRDPKGRAQSIGMSPAFTMSLGAAELALEVRMRSDRRLQSLFLHRHFGLGRCEQEGGALGQGHNPGRVVFDWADDLPRLQCSFLLKSAPYAEIGNPTSRILVLFAQGLGKGFAVRIKEFLSAVLPRRSEFGRCNVPVRPAFLGNGP